MVIPKSDAPSEASSKKSATMVIPKSEAPSEASSKKSATMTLPKSKAPSEAASKKSATMAIPKPEFQTRQILYEQPGMPDEEKASKIASDESEDAVIATESRAGPRYVYPDKRDPGFLPYMRSGSVSLEIQASLTSDTVVEVDPAVIRKRNLGQMEWVLSRIYGFMDTDMPEIWRPRPSGSRYNSQRDLAGDTWGVLNLITLYNETRQIEFVYKARALIKEVHEVLGRARLDEKDLAGRSRRWSQVFVRPPERLGLSTDDHPVLGGLRDGYDIHEKYVEGDGQTFENLLRWAYALNRFALWTRDVTYNDQAVELLQLAHRAFCKRPGSDRPRFMYRMDVDRTKFKTNREAPLSTFEAYCVYSLVADLYDAEPEEGDEEVSVLVEERHDCEKMVDYALNAMQTSDPLEIGVAFWCCHALLVPPAWVKQLKAKTWKMFDDLEDQLYWSREPFRRLMHREIIMLLGVLLMDPDKDRALFVKEQIPTWMDQIWKHDRIRSPNSWLLTLQPSVWDPQVQPAEDFTFAQMEPIPNPRPHISNVYSPAVPDLSKIKLGIFVLGCDPDTAWGKAMLGNRCNAHIMPPSALDPHLLTMGRRLAEPPNARSSRTSEVHSGAGSAVTRQSAVTEVTRGSSRKSIVYPRHAITTDGRVEVEVTSALASVSDSRPQSARG